MRLVDGIFKYGETVAIDVDGKLLKRKVHYADGELFVEVDGQRIRKHELSIKHKFDKGAYDQEYTRKHRMRFYVNVDKKQGESWKNVASDLGMSMNAFIIYCVEKEIHGQ